MARPAAGPVAGICCRPPQMKRIGELAANRSALLDSVKGFVFDCDGVVWRGNDAIAGAGSTLQELRQAGKKVQLPLSPSLSPCSPST